MDIFDENTRVLDETVHRFTGSAHRLGENTHRLDETVRVSDETVHRFIGSAHISIGIAHNSANAVPCKRARSGKKVFKGAKC